MSEFEKERHGFDEEIASAFPEIAEEAAAIDLAEEDPRLYADLREQTRILALMHDISQELTSILDREALLRAIAQRVKRLVDYQLFSVLLWNEQTQLLEHIFSLRYDKRIHLRTTLPLGVGLCGTAAMEKRPVRVGRVSEDPRYVRCESGAEVKSELVVPLVLKGRVMGVLDLESVHEDAFQERDEQIVFTLATTTAIALENARLYEQVRAGEQRLADDLARAREVQQMLLPESAPHLPGLEVAVGYRSARELGGDFYDFLPYGDGRLAIAVGDVAGKGTAAALYGSLGVGILREHAVTHPCPPREMLAHINERLQHPRTDGRFIAMSMAVFDSRTRALEIASAGIPRPLLVRNGKVETIAVEGVPLGMLPDIQYDAVNLQLVPGDIVVFCSDGIHECCNQREEEFGQRRLSEELLKLSRSGTPQEIATGLLDATEQHGDVGDDRTVVVLKVLK